MMIYPFMVSGCEVVWGSTPQMEQFNVLFNAFDAVFSSVRNGY